MRNRATALLLKGGWINNIRLRHVSTDIELFTYGCYVYVVKCNLRRYAKRIIGLCIK